MQNEEKNYNNLKELSLREGMSLFGVADLKGVNNFPKTAESIVGNLRYAVSIGYRLSKQVFDSIIHAPSKIYYFHYQRVNILLDSTALKICGYICNEGFNAFPVPASQVLQWAGENEIEKGFISHKEIALRAGLGKRGWNNLLVTPEYGSQVRLATVFTDMPLFSSAAPGNLQDGSGDCAGCGKCLAACPAGAIKPDAFDLAACRNKLKEFQKTQSIGQMICGICVKACLPEKRK